MVFWYISLSLTMAHKAKTCLEIDVLVSISIILHWIVLLRWSLFHRTVNLCQQSMNLNLILSDLRLPTLIILLVMENIWMVCIFSNFLFNAPSHNTTFILEIYIVTHKKCLLFFSVLWLHD